MNRVLTLALFVTAHLFACDQLKAELLLNGGFESPAGTVLNITPGNEPAGMAWSVVSGNVDIGAIPFLPFVLYPAYEGSQILDLNGNQRGAISQSFATVAGSTYTLSFQYADNPDETGVSSASVSIVDAQTSTSLLSTSVSHSTSTNAPIFADWTSFSAQFVATGTLSTLTFTSTSASNTASGGIFLDAVSITAIPEPSSLMLLAFVGTGVAFFHCSRSRRRAKCLNQ